MRLANAYAEKEKWSSAVTYMQRAHRVRPKDADLTERLFQLVQQRQEAAGRPQGAGTVATICGPTIRSSTCTSWT